MITDDLGFMLIHISKENIDKFKEKINNEPGWEPEIIILEPQISKKRTIIEEFELIKSENYKEIEKTDMNISKKKIASLFWGLVEPKKEVKWKEGKCFDDYFVACEKEFDKRLKKIFEQGSVIINDQKRILLYESKLRLHPNAKKLHQRIKVFVLKHLIDREEKDLEREIYIEAKDPDLLGTPDIHTNEEAFEIETFYGRGDPITRLTNLIKKYIKSNFKKLRIIITNLDAILWYKKLITLKNEFEKRTDLRIYFETLDLEDEKLIPISSIRSKYLKILKEF